MVNFINMFFNKNSSSSRILPKVEVLKIVVTEFVEYGTHNYADAFCKLLRKNKNFDVHYFREPFDKSFLSLQGRHFFDLADAGNKILQKLNADIIVWGYQENENIRLNFQTANTYYDWTNVSCSILDSLYLPVESFEHINFLDDVTINLINGALVCSISEQRIDLKYIKNKLLKDIITKFNSGGPAKNNGLMSLPYTMNILGLMYLTYFQKNLTDKNLPMVRDLLNNALSYKSQIMQNIHLGCIYKNLAQLSETAINMDLKGHWGLYREAISNYRLAQRYLDHYNYPYDFALIAFKLSQLYFNYWKFSNDIQALRDAVFYLREAEKTYTQIAFPELWSKIEGYLGFYLSLLGLFSKSNEISKLAIKSYKNKQLVYRKELYPVAWAKTQENIGNVYYNMGKNAKDKVAFNEAIRYYKSALKIYETKNMHQEITIINNSIEKTLRACN